jgi:hypothetical protein
MPFIPEARYIRYMEIGEIKQQMRKDLAAGKLNSLQKSLFENRPPEFLFNIDNDLWETKNLATDPDSKTVLNRMRNELKEEVLSSCDVMFLPEYEIARLSNTTTAYEFRLNKDNYPLEDIYQVASLSGFRGEDVTEKQVKALEDPNKIIRYWAVLGLRSQSREDLQPYSQAIEKMMDDKYLPVAVTASTISYEMFGSKKAEENMKKFCASDDLNISLMAVNYLLYTTTKKPFVAIIRKVHDKKDSDYNLQAACMDFLGSLELVPNNYEYRN